MERIVDRLETSRENELAAMAVTCHASLSVPQLSPIKGVPYFVDSVVVESQGEVPERFSKAGFVFCIAKYPHNPHLTPSIIVF